jgi:hypothetical protein
MAKYFNVPTLILLLAILLSGCGDTTVSPKPIVENPPEEETVEVVNETDQEVSPVEKASVDTVETKAATTENENVEKPTDQTKVNETKSETSTKTDSKTTTKVEQPKQQSTTTQPKKEEPKPKTETPTPTPKPEPPATKVTITVVGPKDVGTIINTTEVAFKDGDTILDVLKQIAKKQDIYVDYTGSGAMGYVIGIDNIYEFDYGPKSGWTCKLNGATLTKSSDAIKVKEGDRIDWIYKDDYSNDK